MVIDIDVILSCNGPLEKIECETWLDWLSVLVFDFDFDFDLSLCTNSFLTQRKYQR